MKISHIFLTLGLISIWACSNDPKPVISTRLQHYDNGFKDTLENINKILIKKDQERIEAYIKRVGPEMDKSKTGLRYAVIESQGNPKAKNKMTATINCRTELLDGTVVFDSKNDGWRRIRVGYTESEAGLDEGISMMGTGDSAHFIAPPYLAKGLLGDFNKIPSRSVLVYKIRLISLKKRK
ncbi:MAG: FKBP-type peptidyl-prolyl cis-trans isomerase [Bacteroidota bacterium]|nr:FKBP-type peptidyl-prolyl cis-trans isomerase [Bacteroidota bacterium]